MVRRVVAVSMRAERGESSREFYPGRSARTTSVERGPTRHNTPGGTGLPLTAARKALSRDVPRALTFFADDPGRWVLLKVSPGSHGYRSRSSDLPSGSFGARTTGPCRARCADLLSQPFVVRTADPTADTPTGSADRRLRSARVLRFVRRPRWQASGLAVGFVRRVPVGRSGDGPVGHFAKDCPVRARRPSLLSSVRHGRDDPVFRRRRDQVRTGNRQTIRCTQ